MTALEVSRYNAAVSLLAGSVPNEQLDCVNFFRDVNLLELEVNNSGFIATVIVRVAFSESHKKRAFTD
jgi:hypothetical protein